MTPIQFTIILLSALIFGLACGWVVGRFHPSPRLLDDTWDEGWRNARAQFTHPDVIAQAHDSTPIEPTRVISPEPDTGTLYNLNDPKFWFPENQERIRAHGYRVGQVAYEGPEPEYDPDTWLHDELMKTYDWAEKQREKGARWVRRMPNRPVGPERPLEIAGAQS